MPIMSTISALKSLIQRKTEIWYFEHQQIDECYVSYQVDQASEKHSVMGSATD